MLSRKEVSTHKRNKALRYIRKTIARAKKRGNKSVAVSFKRFANPALYPCLEVAPRLLCSLGKEYTIEPAKDIHFGYALEDTYVVSWE